MALGLSLGLVLAQACREEPTPGVKCGTAESQCTGDDACWELGYPGDGACNTTTCLCQDLGGTTAAPDTTGESTDDPTAMPTTTATSDPVPATDTTMDETSNTTEDPGGSRSVVCVRDVSTTDVEPNGARVDAIQNYTGDSDEYAVTTTCNFGPDADPARTDCTMVSGEKDFCSGGTGYVTLGGAGGWVCGELALPIENGNIITAVVCGGDSMGVVELGLCSEPDPDSPTCVPCPIRLNGSCEASGL